jgi:Holliday junction DNA helicase RuvA
MIGRLKGTLVRKQPPGLLVDVGGVGYELEAPLSTFYDLPAVGETVTLHTHLVVRDDAHLLFGFARESERHLFRTLLKVSGVGARMALAILSGMTAEDFARCVATEDVTALTKLPGIGRKTGERLVIEMRDRLDDGALRDAMPGAGATGGTPPAGDDPVTDATSALVALGYRPAEATKMIRKLDTDGLATEDIIRGALQAAVR